MRVTERQRRLLGMLREGPKSTRWIVTAHGVSRANIPLTTPDSIHSSMRRMENRDLVRRVYHPTDRKVQEIRWELTNLGRSAMRGG